ncbi:MAG: hypothetical protein WC028_01780 [Candidatus Obscuribacterales bacterium]
MILTIQSSTVGAKAREYYISTSIKQSKKEDYFRKSVKVDPASFNYGGHTIAISACWLEEEPNEKMYLILKFKVDGRVTKEHEIAHYKDMHYRFNTTEDEPEVKRICYFRFLPLSSIPRLIIGAFGQHVHFVQFKSLALPKNLRLRLSIGGVEKKEKMTDTFLEFQLK